MTKSLKQFSEGSLSKTAINGLYDYLKKVDSELAHKFLIVAQLDKELSLVPQLGVSFDLVRNGNFGAGVGVSTDGKILLDANYKVEKEILKFADLYIHGGLTYSFKQKNTGLFAGFEVKF